MERQLNISMNSFTGKEKDAETGYSYFGARYYDSDLSGLFLSVDPMADKYQSISPYAYCAWNPLKLVDPDGREVGDYYTTNGTWLGSDGKKDDLAYTATSVQKNSQGFVISAENKELLPILNSELLDRATWVCGESGGSGELITSRTQNIGDPRTVSDATVAEYYAFAIQNAVTRYKDFKTAAKMLMKIQKENKTISTYEGYFQGQGAGGNSNSKDFAAARMAGGMYLNKDVRFINSISAVIKSVSKAAIDPTGGCKGWLGSNYARKYCNDSRSYKKQAIHQFSFSSSESRFFHSFYTSGQ